MLSRVTMIASGVRLYDRLDLTQEQGSCRGKQQKLATTSVSNKFGQPRTVMSRTGLLRDM